jgi:plastocyanin
MAKFLKKIKPKEKNLKPKGSLWLVILLLLGGLTISVSFFSRQGQYDIAALAVDSKVEEEKKERVPRIYSVFYKNGTFSPTNIRVRAGDTVRFENHGLFSIHIISEDLVGFDSIGPVPTGGVFSYTFTVPGIFSYYNKKNVDQNGKVIVR